jgi:hypothetical protein
MHLPTWNKTNAEKMIESSTKKDDDENLFHIVPVEVITALASINARLFGIGAEFEPRSDTRGRWGAKVPQWQGG